MFRIFNIILMTMSMTYAQDLDILFSDANKSYNNGQFDDAAEVYESILSEGFYSSDLYYNLGNAYYRLEDLGNARWSYEMGFSIQPRDRDIIHNLTLIKQKIPNALEVPDSQILSSIKNFLASFAYSDFIFFSSLMFFFYSVSSVLYRVNPSNSTALYYYLFMILFFLGTSSSGIKFLWENNNNFGIILNDETQLYSAPFLNDNIKISIFFSGNKVKIEQKTDKWLEISSMDGRKGWIRLKDIRTLD
ncbi:MAG: hypothetical protein H8E55_32050 [Pelagibacterales bacterium]|nr:hypothetical protein [Pelagibacterales bacterium]